MDPLTEALGGEPPASVQQLPEATRTTLADLLVAARRATTALNKRSVEAAVQGVPLPVRGVVRKALGA